MTTSAERAAQRARRGRRAKGAAPGAAAVEGEVRSPRTGAKRTLMGTIQQIPHYLRLLAGLLTDPRVPMLDKALVGAAIAYILLPADFIPDFIPFIGEVDDIFLLVTALQRLIANAGRRVVLEHWGGEPSELADLNLRRVLTAATFFLPGRIRRRLKALGRD
ncbi:MAG: YkvA family protein [Gemmatimonadaceae bacterium]